MLSNLLHKNKSANNLNTQPLAANPLISNATQMNNEFLSHHKPLLNQQGSWVQQQSFSQAPLITQAPLISQAPLMSAPLTSTFPLQSRGLGYRKGGPYRQFRLRTHNWGQRSENGWSGFNNWKYQSQNLSSWEHKSIILEELRSQYRNQGFQSRGFNGVQQQSFLPIAQAPLMAAPLASPLGAAPTKSKRGFYGKNGARKNKRGHHHGMRNKRATAVLPVQPLAGGPAIATTASSVSALPIQNLSIQQSSFATRSAPIVSPVLAKPIVAPVVSQSIASPVQTIMKPAIVQETIRTDRVLEVQKIVHREVEQPIVHHIEKHITEAPAPSMGGVVRMAPIVQQNMNTRVINEVTPIVHRELAVRQVERVEEHLQERVVAPTQHTNSVQYEAAALPVAPVVAPVIARELPAQSPTILAPINAPALHETIALAPVVEETLRTDRVVEIQPVVHREVEQNVINHIEKHITEAPAPAMGGVVRMAPIVQETHNTRVIEEIQPVVHRERVQLQADRVEEHVVEHIVAPTQHTNSVVTESAAINTFAVAPLATSANLSSSATLLEQPLVNTTPITKVVPTLEKKHDTFAAAPLTKNTYGSAMM